MIGRRGVGVEAELTTLALLSWAAGPVAWEKVFSM